MSRRNRHPHCSPTNPLIPYRSRSSTATATYLPNSIRVLPLNPCFSMCDGLHLGFCSPQATAFFFAKAFAMPRSFFWSGQITSSRHLSLPPASLSPTVQLLANPTFAYDTARRPLRICHSSLNSDLPRALHVVVNETQTARPGLVDPAELAVGVGMVVGVSYDHPLLWLRLATLTRDESEAIRLG
jgi:hypothetical protein